MDEDSQSINLNITKEMALKIGEALFYVGSSQEFIDKTDIGVRDRGDGTYAVFCYEKGIVGGDTTYVIRKTDGKVMAVEYGE